MNFMQLRKYRGDNSAIMGCKQREGESLKDYFQIFNKATLDIPGQDNKLITGAFTWGLLPGLLSRKFLGRPPQSRHKMKERVERFLRQEEGIAEKQAYLQAATERRGNKFPNHPYSMAAQRHAGPGNRPFRRYNAHPKEGGRGRRSDVYAIRDGHNRRNQGYTAGYCEYHHSKTHNTHDCTMLRREVPEKQLKGNLVELARTLRDQNEKVQHTLKPQKGYHQHRAPEKEILAIRSFQQSRMQPSSPQGADCPESTERGILEQRPQTRPMERR
ncbi:hypothetical protein L2E82_18408 [Cichorium intybus]|uniref:Uncharacterized protein n=1 Tax=Cichorium intybus TaxID=13427 RepID=A0ACB9F9J2_CICIN|nr:hypothetical protein L2E82_18408 [Cichorium intybus]